MLSFDASGLNSLEMLQFRLKLAGRGTKKRILVSTGKEADKASVLPVISELVGFNVEIFATEGTSAFLSQHGIPNTRVYKINEGKEPNIRSLLKEETFDFVVNIVTGNNDYDERSDSKVIRERAIEDGNPLITDAGVAIKIIAELVKSLKSPTRSLAPAKIQPWNLHQYFLSLVHDLGGWANYHAHLDKAYLITPEYLNLGQIDMQKKWALYKTLKQNYTPEDLYERINRGVQCMFEQGVTYFRTLIDADPTIKLMGVEAALAVKKAWKGRIHFEIGTQPLEGVLKPEARHYFEKGCSMVDVVGGLPSKDRPQPEAHLDVILRIASEQGKRLDVHVDQENNPFEDETKLLALMTMKHGMEGRVSAVHSISPSCKSDYEQDELAKMLVDAGISVIVCPSAALSMRQLKMKAPLHNSIAPVERYMRAGVKLVMGTDNINDFFMPFVDGDMWTEVRLLMESTRLYEAETFAKIACDKSCFIQ